MLVRVLECIKPTPGTFPLASWEGKHSTVLLKPRFFFPVVYSHSTMFSPPSVLSFLPCLMFIFLFQPQSLKAELYWPCFLRGYRCLSESRLLINFNCYRMGSTEFGNDAEVHENMEMIQVEIFLWKVGELSTHIWGFHFSFSQNCPILHWLGLVATVKGKVTWLNKLGNLNLRIEVSD